MYVPFFADSSSYDNATSSAHEQPMWLTWFQDIEAFDFGDNVDVPTFEQILDMDDDGEEDAHEFSRSIVFGYLEQAESTFVKKDDAV